MKTRTKGRARGGGRGGRPGRVDAFGNVDLSSWMRGMHFSGPIADILLSAAYTLGTVESLREQVAHHFCDEHSARPLRHLDRAIKSIAMFGSIIGLGTRRLAAIRRAAR